MGIESLQPRKTFGMEELGLLDSSPLRSLNTIVGLCAEAVGAPVAALLVFDDRTGSLVLRSVVGATLTEPGPLNVSIIQSASSLAREEGRLISIGNLAARRDTRDAVERQKFGATGFLAAPVRGPAGDVVGVLAAMTPSERHWTGHDRELAASYAMLASEQIMLRAALHTVKLMAEERAEIGGFVGCRN